MKPFVKCCLSTSVAALVACGGGPVNPGNNTSSSVQNSQPASSTPVSSTPASSTPVSSAPASSSSSSQPSNGNEKLVFAVNVGGPETTYEGVTYISDNDYFLSSGGTPHDTTDPISNTDQDTLFQSERYGEYSYEIPVTNATYRVVLHFVEMYNEESGARSFNVSLEGSEEISGLDIFSVAGHDAAYTEEFSNIVVNDESLTISLETIADQGTLSGIAIYSTTGEFVEPPEPEPLPPSAENPSAECNVGNLPSSGFQSTQSLPDPFTKLDGTRITTKEEWRCRREEILQQAYKYIYGNKPAMQDGDTVTGSVSGNTITVNVSHNGRSTSFTASITNMPSGPGPHPAVIAFSTNDGITDILREKGVAIINFSSDAVAADSGNLSGRFFTLYSGETNSGLLGAWAWGVSRIIDVLEQNPNSNINPTRLGVTGCSRLGKAAFVAGALDHRIALTLPVESGIGGLSSIKLTPRLNSDGGEMPSHAAPGGYRPWFSSVIQPFLNSTNSIPVDIHEVVGLIAPNGIYSMDNHGNLQDWKGLNIHASTATMMAAKRLFQGLGVPDAVSYVAGNQFHCSWNSAFGPQLRANVDRFLLDNGSGTGEISVGPVNVNIDNYIDWTVPNLSGTLDLSVE